MQTALFVIYGSLKYYSMIRTLGKTLLHYLIHLLIFRKEKCPIYCVKHKSLIIEKVVCL